MIGDVNSVRCSSTIEVVMLDHLDLKRYSSQVHLSKLLPALLSTPWLPSLLASKLPFVWRQQLSQRSFPLASLVLERLLEKQEVVVLSLQHSG